MLKTKETSSLAIHPRLVYAVGMLLVLDLLLMSLSSWFGISWLSAAYLAVIFLLLVLKPRWGIVFLIFTTVLDTVKIGGVRPYQWLIVMLLGAWILVYDLALINPKIKKRLKEVSFFRFLKDVRDSWQENRVFMLLLGLLGLASLVGIVNAPDPLYSLKQVVVLAFVLGIAFLINRRARENAGQFNMLTWAVIFSSVPVALFSIYQNIAHERGWESFEIMAARPNGTFYEPDWLGMFTLFALVLLLYQALRLSFKNNLRLEDKYHFLTIWGLIFLNYLVLIISVARASWVGLVAVLGFLPVLTLVAAISKKISRERASSSLNVFWGALFVLVLAVLMTTGLKLTRFDLRDRLLSIVNQEHLVTVAEKNGAKTKIDLEDIERYQQEGWTIREEKVTDENVESRFSAYAGNWELVKKHWFLGQGQGSVLAERGFVHNANNIFYEWWIAGGVGGLVVFLILLGGMFRPLYGFFKLAKESSDGIFPAVFLAGAGSAALFVTNLFNSGIFFAPLWVMVALIWALKPVKK